MRKNRKKGGRERRENKKKGYKEVMNYEENITLIEYRKKLSFQYCHPAIQGACPKPWYLEAPDLQALSCNTPPRETACEPKRRAHLRPVLLPPFRSCCVYSLPIRLSVACGSCEAFSPVCTCEDARGYFRGSKEQLCGWRNERGLEKYRRGRHSASTQSSTGFGRESKAEREGIFMFWAHSVRAWWPFPHKAVNSVMY